MLKSHLFADSPELAAAAVQDSRHVTPGASGRHVGKIQAAVEILDDADIEQSEWLAMRYGPSTADAVLRYKQRRNIINRQYQTQADNIVGKMTVAAMDSELLAAEKTAGHGRARNGKCLICRFGSPPLPRLQLNFSFRQDALNAIQDASPEIAVADRNIAAPAAGPRAFMVPDSEMANLRGFSSRDAYQMIPVGGSRDFRIRTFNSQVFIAGSFGLAGECRIVSSNNWQKTAESDRVFLPNIVPANCTAVVSLDARRDARGIFGLYDMQKRPLSEITVSFKNVRPLTVKWTLLTDALKRTPVRSKTQIADVLKRVRDYYASMCNVRLVFVEAPEGVSVDADLGPVIDLDNTKNTARMALAMQQLIASGQLMLLFTWDIEKSSAPDKRLFGIDLLGVGTPLVLVEDPASPDFPKERDATVIAHELGHALGLPHETVELSNLMFDSTDALGSDLLAEQMDKLNPSASTKP